MGHEHATEALPASVGDDLAGLDTPALLDPSRIGSAFRPSRHVGVGAGAIPGDHVTCPRGMQGYGDEYRLQDIEARAWQAPLWKAARAVQHNTTPALLIKQLQAAALAFQTWFV